MKSGMTLKVLTPKGVTLETSCETVTLPALDGSIGIMHGHAAMVVALCPGQGSYHHGGDKQVFAVTSGLAEVSGDQVVVLMEE